MAPRLIPGRPAPGIASALGKARTARGSSPEAVFLTIATGLAGTPRPSYGGALESQERLRGAMAEAARLGARQERMKHVSFETDMKRPGLPLRAKLFRGLGDLSRLRVLEALRDGPLSAGEIVTRTGLSQPNASMHLACLAECGLVTWERQGKFVHYELADKQVVKLLDQAEELLLRVGPLIEACPRYRRPARAGQRARRTCR